VHPGPVWLCALANVQEKRRTVMLIFSFIGVMMIAFGIASNELRLP
jgi:hypothetical protein